MSNTLCKTNEKKKIFKQKNPIPNIDFLWTCSCSSRVFGRPYSHAREIFQKISPKQVDALTCVAPPPRARAPSAPIGLGAGIDTGRQQTE
jgi:hypothetical protein